MKDVCYVKGAALKLFFLIKRNNNYSFLHPYFKKVCIDLHMFTSFDLVYILNLLHRYAYIYLKDQPLSVF